MKKKLLVVLTMMMLLIITGPVSTASAEDTSTSGTQTITVDPALPTWTLEIPANVAIPFGTTSATNIGAPIITDVSPATFYRGYISCQINHPGVFTGTGEGIGVPTIPYVLMADRSEIPSADTIVLCHYEHNGTYHPAPDLLILVAADAWNSSPVGSYEAKITYSSSYYERFV